MVTIFAYFDPGSGSLILQVLIGGTAGLLVAGRFLWNSIRGKRPQPEPDEKDSTAKDSSGEIPI